MAHCVQCDIDFINIKSSTPNNLDMSFVEDIIDSDYNNTSKTREPGIWYPIVITQNDNQAEYCDLLHKSKEDIDITNKYYEKIYKQQPCSSLQVDLFDITSISDDDFGFVATAFNSFEDTSDIIDSPLNCIYCGNYTTSWTLKDQDGNESKSFVADCCNGACDVRTNKNDYLPKIPLLNHHYYTDIADFPYIGEFPARSNPGLGKERFLEFDLMEGGLISLDDNVFLCIDWKLKETISEEPYDELRVSDHPNKNLHTRSYKKAKIVDETCGNFILTKLNQTSDYDPDGIFDDLTIIPEEADFTKPYGIKGSSINNVFIGGKKRTSFWKWNYTSGILGWYRYYEPNRTDDDRPIPGFDLYISKGDVFYAKNATIEPDSNNQILGGAIKSCPSGLKIVEGSKLTAILPNDSEFFYISQNIYGLFLEWRERYIDAGLSVADATAKAQLMATAPQFDNVTTDLLDVGSYATNEFGLIDSLSEKMQVGNKFDSDNLSYVTSEEKLISMLEYKYGSYIWIPNSSNSKGITFEETLADNFVIETNFDLVIDETSTGPYNYEQIIQTNGNRLLKTDRGRLEVIGITYEAPDDYNKIEDIYPRITHNQKNSLPTYCTDCDKYSTFYLNPEGPALCQPDGDSSFCYDVLANFLNNSQGETEGTRPLRSIKDDTLREIRTYNFFHYYIDTFAINSNNSVYVDSAMYDVPIGVTKDSSTPAINNDKLSLLFNTSQNVGIKIYWASLKQVQNSHCLENERFPVDLDNLCICFKDGSYVPNVSADIELQKNGGSSSQVVPTLNTRQDPNLMDQCTSSVSVSLPNYVTSTWEINPSLAGNLSLSVDENIDFTLPPWQLEVDPDNTPWHYQGDFVNAEFWYSPRKEWKRFTTRVDVSGDNGQGIDEELAVLYDKGSASIGNLTQYKIKLTNPFLEALIDDEELVQNIHPTGVDCGTYAGMSGLIGPRGDEISIVNLTFTQKNPKQELSFYFDQVYAGNTLHKSNFDPASGLIDDEDQQYEPVVDGKINYALTASERENAESITYRGHIEDIQDVLYNLPSLGSDRRLSLYLKEAGTSSSAWWKLNLNRGFSSFQDINGESYQGRPTIFEYAMSIGASKKLPYTLQGISKKNKWFKFLKHTDITKSSDIKKKDYVYDFPEYPLLSSRDFKKIDTKTMAFRGTRYYYLIPTIFNIVTLLKQQAVPIENISEIHDVTDYSSEINNYTIEDPNSVVLIDQNYYKYTGGDLSDVSNYLDLGTNIKILMNLNDLQLDMTNVAEDGYILNSKKLCNKQIACDFSSADNFIYTTLKNKQLKVVFLDKNNRPTSKSKSVKSEIWTYCEHGPLNGFDFKYLKGMFFEDELLMTILYNSTGSTDTDDLLSNSNYKFKWADVIDYIKNTDFNNYYNSWMLDIVGGYNKEYFSWFSDFKLNSLMLDDYKIYYADNDFQSIQIIEQSDHEFYSNGLQTYNLEKNQRDTDYSNYYQHHNYIPLMDIRIQDPGNININSEGYITTPSFVTPYVSARAIDPELESLFWINLDKSTYLERAIIPEEEYSPTFRIDGPLNGLKKIDKKTTTDKKGKTYRKTFTPSLTFNSSASSRSSRESKADGSFVDFPVYGDVDQPKCEPQVDQDKRGLCVLDEIGKTSGIAIIERRPNSNIRLSDLNTDSLNYILTYDRGYHHPLHTQSVSIQRSSLPFDNYLYPANSCNTSYLQPEPLKGKEVNFYDQNYQNAISDNIEDLNAHDNIANEMLYRIMHGSSDGLNRNSFGYTELKVLNEIDLISYAPAITARDIYDQIHYNYNRNANFYSFVINGTIDVSDCLLSVDTEYELIIDGQTLKISIVKEDNIVKAKVDFGDAEYEKDIFDENNTTYNYIVSEDVISPSNANTSLVLVETLQTISKELFHPIARRTRTSNVALIDVGVFKVQPRLICYDVEPPLDEGPFQGMDGVTSNVQEILRGPTTEKRNGHIIRSEYFIQKINVNNIISGISGKIEPKLLKIPKPFFYSKTTSCEAPTEKNPDPPIEYGYCQRTVNDCEPNDADGNPIYQTEGGNVTYNFQQCRHSFDLYGYYYYKKKIEDEDEDEDISCTSSYCPSNYAYRTYNMCTTRDEPPYVNDNPFTDTFSTPKGDMLMQKYPSATTWAGFGPGGIVEYIDYSLEYDLKPRGNSVLCWNNIASSHADTYPGSYTMHTNNIEPYFLATCPPEASDTGGGGHYYIWKILYGNTPAFFRYDNSDVDDRAANRPNEDYTGKYAAFSTSLCTDATHTYLSSLDHNDYGRDPDDPDPLFLKLVEWVDKNATYPDDIGNLAYGDEGYDYCGYLSYKDSLPERYLYLQTTQGTNTYEPEDGFQITYNEHSINILIAGVTICIDNDINTCPRITLDNRYTNTHTIVDSSCNSCSSNSKLSFEQKDTYKTITATETLVLSTFEGADVNDQTIFDPDGIGSPLFSRTFRSKTRGWYRQRSEQYFTVLCGDANGYAWYTHDNIEDHMGLYQIKYNKWVANLKNAFNTTQIIGVVENSVIEKRAGAYNLSESTYNIMTQLRRMKDGNAHITESDILRGVVPGSISALKFKSTAETFTKVRTKAGSMTDYETDEGTYYTNQAYVTYKYVRPYSLQDAIKQSRITIGSDGGSTPTDYGDYSIAESMDFPLWYGQSLGISGDESFINRPRTKNFVVTAMNFSQDSESCSSFKCDYNRFSDSKYYAGCPCPENDHYCWSISSWNSNR